MYVVTNRTVDNTLDGLEKFGDTPNPAGPNELRLVEVRKTTSGWDAEVLPDAIPERMKREVKITEPGTVYASRYVARRILSRVQKEKRNVLFFVHGYNNNLQAVIERADRFAETYGVEVIAFSWPANGGGARGLVSYKSDKRDARASAGALDRTLAKLHDLLDEFNRALLEKISADAHRRFPDDGEARDRYITEQAEKGCPFTVTMVLHSMGNYLFKQILQSSVYRGNLLIFDNIVLASADTNNKGHAAWVDRIRMRKRVYVTINEDDSALMASRIKSGEDQLARLGHYPSNLSSTQAVYVNFTGVPWVRNSHAYFEGTPLRNSAVKQFFDDALNGKRAEEQLDYDTASRMYQFRRR